MIHGGGFMTLSKTAIRPYQTQHLLNNGFLPIGIDFQLCPEIDLIAGPMADVRDALGWVRDKLPAIARAHAIKVDATKLVVVGWSTGGHLAMTTAWTCTGIGQEPPVAILSFYGPTDFQSEGASPKYLYGLLRPFLFFNTHTRLTIGTDIDRRRAEQYPERTISFERIRQSLPKKPVSRIIQLPTRFYTQDLPRLHPHRTSLLSLANLPFPIQITSYDSPTGTDGTNLGWVRPGDPRSELVLSLFKESHGLRVMLNGLSETALSTPPPRSKVEAISPMAQLRSGRYRVPTFVIHADKDEIAPFRDSEKFVETLSEKGVECGLGRVRGKKHIHDLALRPGKEGWDEEVGLGYDFIFRVVEQSGSARV